MVTIKRGVVEDQDSDEEKKMMMIMTMIGTNETILIEMERMLIVVMIVVMTGVMTGVMIGLPQPRHEETL